MSRQLLAMALAPLLGLFILGIGNGFLSTVITLRLDAAGESAVVIGWVSSAYFIGLALGAMLNDRLLLRIGHIRAYGSFASLVAVTVLLQGLFEHPWAWFALRLIGGWATVGVYLVIESWLLTAGDARVRGRLLALYMISLYAAGVLGQLLLGVTEAMGGPSSFMVIGLLASLSVLPMAMIPRVSPLIEKAEPLPPLRLITLTPTGVMGSFGSGLAVAAVYALLPLYLQRIGFTVDRVGQMMAIVVLGALLLQYPVGRWSDRHDRQIVLIGIGGFCTLISAAILWLPMSPWLLAGLLFLLGGGVFSLYPVAVGHAADRAPAGALVRMSQGLLLINAIGSAVSPPLVSPVMGVLGDAGLFWSFGALGLFLVAFFGWRRSVRPAPVPVAPFHPTAPMSAAGAELVVTEELVQGAIEHEHMEDLSDAVPEVAVAEPLVGPPPADEAHVAYFEEPEPEEAPTQAELALEPAERR
ncbi:Predicted arabinose efflux permease, MFS family [Halomonas shengliensis]|uniref:Predicted arabinose efflux permease, MFS family n=1 Tax=Halomonas shengliensis TaxID=419597 RepID=A0A1H0DNC7_9GAMM|nr:MFS transporter [Halomonas shengliensis]SDN71553.1 Predicted arabinose efflux permease, MFS family [Halomonas shengliensis]